MRFKKGLITSILVGIMVIGAIGNSSEANTNSQIKEEYEEERLKHDVIQPYSDTNIEEGEFSEEDAALLEKKYIDNLEKRLKEEEELADTLANIINDESLKIKVISVEKEDKIDAMHIMINILENIDITKDIQEKIKSYINLYGPYTGDDMILKYIEKSKVANIDTYSAYNRAAAVNYAYKWWETYNSSSYPDLSFIGGDCANFVSQAIREGGKTTDSEWYIKRKNYKYSKPTNVSQLDYSWDLSDPSPWISAVEFNNYWEDRVSYHGSYNASFVYENPETIYNANYYRGDVVQILRKNYWWYEAFHTMIITKYEQSISDYRLTYHTSNTKDILLNWVAKRYNSDGYRIKFFRM